jgi:hypothetical protein
VAINTFDFDFDFEYKDIYCTVLLGRKKKKNNTGLETGLIFSLLMEEKQDY